MRSFYMKEDGAVFIRFNGILKFEGRMSADIEEIFRAVGVNRYYVMSSNELKVVYLTK